MEQEKAEGIKKQSKFKKGCMGCLGVSLGIILIIFIYLTILSGATFISPSIWGRVYDKETGKPIEYALVTIAYDVITSEPSSSISTLTKKDGNYFLSQKIFFGWPLKASEWLIPGLNKRKNTTFIIWFPGYKRYEIRTEGRKLILGKIDIYLERPKITNEAVRYVGVSGEESSIFEKFAKGDKEKFCELVAYWLIAGYKFQAEIIKKNPKTETADKIFKWDPEVAKFIDCDYILDDSLRNKCKNIQRNIDDILEYKKNQCLGWYKPR